MSCQIDPALKIYSKMPAIYLHISGEDVEEKILTAHGIIKFEETMAREEELKPVECPVQDEESCRIKILLLVLNGLGLNTCCRSTRV